VYDCSHVCVVHECGIWVGDRDINAGRCVLLQGLQSGWKRVLVL
jgi:hypothetical protein